MCFFNSGLCQQCRARVFWPPPSPSPVSRASEATRGAWHTHSVRVHCRHSSAVQLGFSSCLFRFPLCLSVVFKQVTRLRTTPFGNTANLEAGQTESMEWALTGWTMPGKDRPTGWTIPGNDRPSGWTMPGKDRPTGWTMPGKDRPTSWTMPGIWKGQTYWLDHTWKGQTHRLDHAWNLERTDPLAGPYLERTDHLAGHKTMPRKERPDNRTDAGRTGLDWTELAGPMTRTFLVQVMCPTSCSVQS